LRIKKFFNLGHINYDDKSKEFIIYKRSDILERVIPHFNKYPLIGHKLSIFNIFSEIVTFIDSETHLTSPEAKAKLDTLIDKIRIIGNKGFSNISLQKLTTDGNDNLYNSTKNFI